MTTSAAFRRNIVQNYPACLLPEDLRGEFNPEEIVTVTVEALQAIKPGDSFIETVLIYQDGSVVQQSETVLTWS